ncbi:MAG: hypothetical protein ACR2LQ_01845 [Acidimicrobiales bacterium]
MKRRDRPTSIDETRVGLSFIEVLFALVVARALDPLADFSSIPGVGLSHLGVAFVLTVTSWIGYHNSWNRPRYFIRFANLPLWQFVIDVLLVITYWFCAVSAEGTGTGLGKAVSARPEVLCVAISFVMYSLWDAVGHAIRMSDLYERSPPSRDVPRRRYVTILCAATAIGIAVVVWRTNPSSKSSIVFVDVLLVLLILTFRFAKEARFVTPNAAYDVRRVE